MARLRNKVLIVTGGGSGIGRAAAELFAREGARVVIADLSEQAGTETGADIMRAGGEALFIRTDVSDETGVASLVAAAIRHFGRLDGAFNNAGIEQSHQRVHETALEQWQKIVAVDLTGVFLCMKHEIAAMLPSGGGAIVNTASSLAQVAIAHAADYVAAKHGVVGLTRAAAIDYARQGVRVNAVLPGMTATAMLAREPETPEIAAMFESLRQQVPMGRLARPEEIAEAALWLLSDAASFTTGALLPIDGGFLAV